MKMNLSFLTLAELRETREEWMGAFRALSTGVKSYTLGSREVTRYDIDEVAKVLAEIGAEIEAKTSTRRLRSGRLVPRDG